LTTNLGVVALPVVRREQVSGDRSSAYDRAEVKLTPACYLAEAVTGLPGSADISNVPVTEEEENRLAWLGVELQPLNRDLAWANGVSDQTRDGETGALVTYVHPDSPAAKAGIQAGIVLLRLKVPGQALPVEVQIEEDYARAQAFPWDRLDEVPEQYYERIPTPWPPVENAFTRALTDLGFGTHYTAEFFVDGKLVAKEFEVVAGPTHYDAAPRYKSEALGVTVRDQTYDVRRYLQRKPEDPGVVVARVEPGGKASVAGVKPYEIITHINDQPVNNVKDFEKLAGGGGEMKLSLKRMTKGRIVTIKANSN
jgi:serine protease Do